MPDSIQLPERLKYEIQNGGLPVAITVTFGESMVPPFFPNFDIPGVSQPAEVRRIFKDEILPAIDLDHQQGTYRVGTMVLTFEGISEWTIDEEYTVSGDVVAVVRHDR